MIRRRQVGPALALLAAGFAVACHRTPASNTTSQPPAAAVATSPGTNPARPDSLEGIVRVVGTDALPQVTLATDGAGAAIALDGPASLRRVAGLRIAAVGVLGGARLVVKRFVVLSANGVPATDGVLAADGAATLLVTVDGVRHRLVNPPPLLRESPGRRAWVSGPLDREAVAFGIIE